MKKRSIVATIASMLLKTAIIIMVVVAFISLAKRAYEFGYVVFAERPVSAPPGKNVAVSVDAEMSTMELGEMLEQKGVIRDAYVFLIQAKSSKYGDEIKTGSYVLNTSQTSEEMLKIMARADEEETETEE